MCEWLECDLICIERQNIQPASSHLGLVFQVVCVSCKRMRFSCCRPQSFISDLLCVYSRTHGCGSTDAIRSVCKERVVLATFKHLVGFFSLNCMHVQSLLFVDVPCPAWVRSQSDTALRQWSDLVVEEREGGSSQTRCWIR